MLHRATFIGLPLVLAACTSSSDHPDASREDAAAREAGAADAGQGFDASIGHADGGDAGAQLDDASVLSWHTTCGDPICRVDEPKDAGSNACDAGQQLHLACSTAGAECDPGLGCGVKLRCTDTDPTLRGCPISRAAFKTGIHYLDQSELQRYHDDVMRLGLAHYAYRDDPNAEQRLGFIIEDVEPSRFVEEARDRVDLYAYTSAIVATVKVQEKRIQELEQQLKALQKPGRKSAAR